MNLLTKAALLTCVTFASVLPSALAISELRKVDLVGTAYSKADCATKATSYLKRYGLPKRASDFFEYYPAPSNDCYAVYYEKLGNTK